MSNSTSSRSPFDLGGKVALVVGAGSGIGAASARLLAAQGALVTLADISEAAAREIASTIPGVSHIAQVDLADDGGVRAMVDAVVRRDGRIDIAVTTPSINVRKRILDYSDEEFARVVDLNMRGTFNFLRAVGRVMQRQKSGSIIACSSIRSQVVEPGQGVYAATKAGTLQMIRALAAELGPDGVRCNAVGPGVIDTPLTKPIKDQPEHYQAYARKSVFGRWGKPEEIAGAIAFLASDAASFVTGTILFVDGGWTAVDGRYDPPV